MDIVGYVAEKVGIEKSQAEPAVALLLKFAKESLGDNFSKIASMIPGVDELIAKAPEGGVAGAIGDFAKSMFGGGKGVQGLASLAAGFTQSGLSADKIPETANAVVDFASEQGGDEAKDLLAGIFK